MILQFILSLTSLACFILTILSNERSLALIVLLPIMFFGFAGAGLLETCRSSNRRCQPYNTTMPVLLLFAPSMALLVFYVVRLGVYHDHFQTIPSLLDFGPRNGGQEPTNIAFEVDSIDSYIHCFQGFLASFLIFVAMMMTPSLFLWQRFLETISLLMTFYPVYNFVKQWNVNADTFATSSYFNNGMEWTMGSFTGMAVGSCFYSLVQSRKSDDSDTTTTTTCDKKKKKKKEKEEEDNRGWIHVIAKYLSLAICGVMGLACWASIFGAVVYSWNSWNNCFDDSTTDCVNYDSEKPQMTILVYLVIIPLIIAVVTVVWAFRCRARQEKTEKQRNKESEKESYTSAEEQQQQKQQQQVDEEEANVKGDHSE